MVVLSRLTRWRRLASPTHRCCPPGTRRTCGVPLSRCLSSLSRNATCPRGPAGQGSRVSHDQRHGVAAAPLVVRGCSVRPPPPPLADVSSLDRLAASAQRVRRECSRPGSIPGKRLDDALDVTQKSLESLRKLVPNLLEQCGRYDPYPGVRSNGVRSNLAILSVCVSKLVDVLDALPARPVGNTSLGLSRSLRSLEHHASLLRGLSALLQYVELIVEADAAGDLIVDKKKFPKTFLDDAEALDRTSFYGACQGLQYHQSFRPTLGLIVGAQAATGEAYFHRKPKPMNRSPVAILPQLIPAMNIAYDQQKRAASFLKVTSTRNIDFAKRFWSLAEMNILGLGRALGGVRKCKINRLIRLPPEVIYFDRINCSSPSKTPSKTAASSNKKGKVTAELRARKFKDGPTAVPPPLSADGRPEGVTIRHLVPKGAGPEPSKAIIIHFHGGGFISQTSKSHVVYLSHWANTLGAPVISVDYSTAPEHPYPRGVDDCFYAYAWALKNAARLGSSAEKVILVGDSAGGNFVFSVALLAARYKLQAPDLILAAYPALQIELDPSPARCLSVMDPLLSIGILRACLDAYKGGKTSTRHRPDTSQLPQLTAEVYKKHAAILSSKAFMSPLLATDKQLATLPDVCLMPSTFDPLLDDSIVMAKRLHKLGKKVEVRPVDGAPHGFLNFYTISPLARHACNECASVMAAAIK